MLNAELTRHFRTEINWQRLLFVPFAALLILYITLQDEPDDYEYHLWFFIFTIIWGSFSVVWSIKEERNNNTWYWQQLMPLTPLQLLTGKLLGTLALPWCGGLVVLLPILFRLDTLVVILTAVFINIAAFFITLLTIRDGKVKMTVVMLIIVAATAIMTNARDTENEERLIWYAWSIPQNVFAAIALAAYSVWAAIGSHHLLMRAKRYHIRWWLFLLFMLFHIGYSAGLVENLLPPSYSNTSLSLTYITVIWVVLISAFYAGAFLCGSGGIVLLIDSIKQHNKWYIHTPPWLWLLPALLLFTVLYCLHGSASRYISWQIVALVFFAVRDVAILLIFTMRKRANLPEGICVIVLAVLYLLLPEILEQFNIGSYWLKPYDEDNPDMLLQSAISAAAQSIAMLYLLWRLRIADYWRR